MIRSNGSRPDLAAGPPPRTALMYTPLSYTPSERLTPKSGSPVRSSVTRRSSAGAGANILRICSSTSCRCVSVSDVMRVRFESRPPLPLRVDERDDAAVRDACKPRSRGASAVTSCGCDVTMRSSLLTKVVFSRDRLPLLKRHLSLKSSKFTLFVFAPDVTDATVTSAAFVAREGGEVAVGVLALNRLKESDWL